MMLVVVILAVAPVRKCGQRAVREEANGTAGEGGSLGEF